MKRIRDFLNNQMGAIGGGGANAHSLEKLMGKLKATGLHAFRDMSDEEQRLIWEWAKGIIRNYQKTLGRNIANIRSTEELPLPKEDIKLAIKLSLPIYAQKNIDSMVKNLKSIYKELGNFQSIESGDKKILREMPARRENFSAGQYDEIFKIHEKYMEMVIAEKKSLLEEINNYVTRMKIYPRSR